MSLMSPLSLCVTVLMSCSDETQTKNSHMPSQKRCVCVMCGHTRVCMNGHVFGLVFVGAVGDV